MFIFLSVLITWVGCVQFLCIRSSQSMPKFSFKCTFQFASVRTFFHPGQLPYENTMCKFALTVRLDFCPAQSTWWGSTETDSVWSAFNPMLSFVACFSHCYQSFAVWFVFNCGLFLSLARSMQAVRIDKQMKILDSPSIVADPTNSAVTLALRSIIHTGESCSVNMVKAVDAVLSHCNKQQVSSIIILSQHSTPL